MSRSAVPLEYMADPARHMHATGHYDGTPVHNAWPPLPPTHTHLASRNWLPLSIGKSGVQAHVQNESRSTRTAFRPDRPSRAGWQALQSQEHDKSGAEHGAGSVVRPPAFQKTDPAIPGNVVVAEETWRIGLPDCQIAWGPAVGLEVSRSWRRTFLHPAQSPSRLPTFCTSYRTKSSCLCRQIPILPSCPRQPHTLHRDEQVRTCILLRRNPVRVGHVAHRFSGADIHRDCRRRLLYVHMFTEPQGQTLTQVSARPGPLENLGHVTSQQARASSEK